MDYKFWGTIELQGQPKATQPVSAHPITDHDGHKRVEFDFEGFKITLPLKALHDIVKDAWPKATIPSAQTPKKRK